MKKIRREAGRGKAPAAAALAAFMLLTCAGLSGAHAPVRAGSPVPAAPPDAAACEGDACAQVSVTFDEAKGEHRALNNSAERWVRVAASNLAGAASACVPPGGAEPLPLKSIVGAYRATYAATRCGAGGA